MVLTSSNWKHLLCNIRLVKSLEAKKSSLQAQNHREEWKIMNLSNWKTSKLRSMSLKLWVDNLSLLTFIINIHLSVLTWCFTYLSKFKCFLYFNYKMIRNCWDCICFWKVIRDSKFWELICLWILCFNANDFAKHDMGFFYGNHENWFEYLQRIHEFWKVYLLILKEIGSLGVFHK